MRIDFAALADPTSPLVQAALTRKCAICKAIPEENCRNTCRPGEPLPGRCVHYERLSED